MVYLFCFIWTPLFMYLAEKQLKMGKKKNGWIFIFLAILLPSLVAGLRALDVGRDIKVYVTPVIKDSLSMDFNKYLNAPHNFTGLEDGYEILIYIFAHISSSPGFSLFMLQFLTMFFAVLFAYKSRDKTNMTLVMVIYMLTMYFFSFTFMRQFLAIAIILYSLTFLYEKKYIKTFLLFLLAISIHTASFLSILIYIFIFISESNIKEKNKKRLYLLYVIFALIGVLYFDSIIYFLVNTIKVLPWKFYEYAHSYLQDGVTTQASELIIRVFFIICALFYKVFSEKENRNINIDVVLLLLFTDFATFILSYKIVNASRMGFVFFYLGLFYLIPNFKFSFKDDGKYRFLVTMCCITVLFGWWTYKFVLNHWNETFPYKSDVIKFLH